MLKQIVLIVSVILVSVVVVVCLFLLSPKEHPSGGFKRKWKDSLQAARVTDLVHTRYYIAGFSGSEIILARLDSPLLLLLVEHGSISTVSLKSALTIQHGRVTVDDTMVIVTDLKRHRVLRGDMRDHSLNNVLMNGDRFTDVVLLSASSWIIRQINIKASTNTLVKKSSVSFLNDVGRHTLKKQVDGIFCTDGMLSAAPVLKKIVYTYYYRNEIIVFDSSLHVANRFHTIDTVQTAKIKMASLTNNTSQQLATPPPFVNRRVAVVDDLIFVNSQVESSNESQELQTSSIIDVYRLTDGIYKGSFYLPDYNNIPMKEFALNNHHLYAVHGTFLVEYELSSVFNQ